MHRSLKAQLSGLLIFLGMLPAAIARDDAVSAVQLLRAGGCGGIQQPVPPLTRNALLDRAAASWAGGSMPAAATERSGYKAEATAGLHLNGPDSSTVRVLRQSECRTLMNQSLRDIGVYRRGRDTWLILASAYSAPSRAQAPALAARVLELVNDVRARGTRCGERTFGAAPPVAPSVTLARVALGHATDMAEHNYFEHQDRAGRSPAERVRAAGYREKLVGENIAYGPSSADEVVRGWLDSSGHCENLMDPRFAEMGIAYAAGRTSKRGLYWVQLLAAPGPEAGTASLN